MLLNNGIAVLGTRNQRFEIKSVLQSHHFVSLWRVELTRSVRSNRAEYKTTIFVRAFYDVVARYFSEFRRLFITAGARARAKQFVYRHTLTSIAH